MKSATKILSGLMITALVLPAAAGTASAATYHSDSDTSLGLLDYLENEHRAARAQKPNPEKDQLKADTEEMRKHLRYPIDPTKAAPVAFEGDDLTWNQVTGDFTAKGKVKVTQLDEHRFEGENVDGNTIEERIHIPGKGHMLQFTPGQTEVMLDGFETNYNYRTRTGSMESAKGKVAETYNIGGFNEWKNIDIIKVLINTVDRLLGRPEGADMDLITYVTDRAGHDLRYAIDSSKLQKELGWEPSLQFEEGIEKTVRWYLDNQAWMDNVTSGDYQKYYEDMYKGR